MLKEYCDRCEKEIDREDERAKYKVHISFESPSEFREQSTHFTVCRECFEKMGIRDNVVKTQVGDYRRKDAEVMEKIMGIVRELITECMEEQGYGN